MGSVPFHRLVQQDGPETDGGERGRGRRGRNRKKTKKQSPGSVRLKNIGLDLTPIEIRESLLKVAFGCERNEVTGSSCAAIAFLSYVSIRPVIGFNWGDYGSTRAKTPVTVTFLFIIRYDKMRIAIYDELRDYRIPEHLVTVRETIYP